ncbi:MAG: PEP-CTERM sorting domain-containing protein [Chthoniobacterales bacterium]|nr:PEP-CTERM sorting domain-containing protein [Chthoniobacterales bacterium]
MNTCTSLHRNILTLTLALVAMALPLQAALIIPVTYRGNVESNGIGNGAYQQNNFKAEQGSYNNWFGFNLASQGPTTITSAKLYLHNELDGVTGSGTFTIYDVSPASQATLNSGNTTPGVGVFSDLGSGTSYGSTGYSTADNGNYMIIELNVSGLSDLQTAWGSGFFNIGGAATGTGYTFGYSGFVLPEQTYLEITSAPAAVPEPGTWAAAALLAGGASFTRWRKRAKVS